MAGTMSQGTESKLSSSVLPTSTASMPEASEAFSAEWLLVVVLLEGDDGGCSCSCFVSTLIAPSSAENQVVGFSSSFSSSPSWSCSLALIPGVEKASVMSPHGKKANAWVPERAS